MRSTTSADPSRTSVGQGLEPERVAEIIVGLPGNRTGRRGSGYLVSTGRVLTAAHVVEGATGLCVRFQADRPGERTVEATVEWQHAGVDIAVLMFSGSPDADIATVPFGRVGEHDAVLRCVALGFPRFKLRMDKDGSLFRDTEHMHATCAVLSNRREGTLDLKVTAPPADDPNPERDPWEGMSGAAVFSNGRLVGVVSRRHPADGPARIAAARVDRWAEIVPATELNALEQILGQDLHPTALVDTVPATRLERLQAAYRAQLSDIAPKELEDRERELRDLVEFCCGPDPYLWLQGPPWAGKTALAAWFALHPPRGVVPVWFFITARQANQADGDAYAKAVIDQLAAIARCEPLGNGSPTARDGERKLLLREAAERVAQNGGTLVLVVDGLDEDQSLLLDGNGTSIASLLPEQLPPNVRVLVTSRPGSDILANVRGQHPLRRSRVLKLSGTEAARHIEIEAKFELKRALSGDQLQRDIVGLLAAARGSLTLKDLRELTGEQGYVLSQRLGSAFGRILHLRDEGADSGGDVTLYVAGRGYLFAHETLPAAAQDALHSDIEEYWERLHSWAETYARRGWPVDTPAYLLQPYGRLLAYLRDARRAVALATDARRRDRLREVTGSDAACLAEIAATHQTVRSTTPDDLGTLAALAAAADLVARRNEWLHPDIPAVYARLGRTRHAIGLARSVYQPLDRARALAGVARVLVEAKDGRAVTLAEEALRLTKATVAGDHTPYDDTRTLVAVGRLATALAAAGRESEALHRLSELPVPGGPSGERATVEAFVSTASVLQSPVRAADLLHQAEKSAVQIHFLPARVQAVASIAAAWQARFAPDHAARLYDSVVTLAEQHADDAWNVPADAAEVLRQVRPSEANRMARLAVAHAGKLLQSPLLSDFDSLEASGAVRALVAVDRVHDAQLLTEALREAIPTERPGQWAEAGLAIAVGRAREGRAMEAWAALDSSWEPDEPHSGENHSAARVAGPLAEAGAADQLEKLLLAATDSWQWGVAATLAALAAHFATDDPDRSLRLLQQAERLRPPSAGSLHLDEHLATFAGALATAGRPDEAEDLVGAIRGPDVRAWGYALVSMSIAHEAPHRALRLAELTVNASAHEIDHWDSYAHANTLRTAVYALARAGATNRAVEVIEQIGSQFRDLLGEDYRNIVRAEAAMALWPHAPEVAGQWVDTRLRAMPIGSGSAPGLARLLAVVGPHDSERSARITEMLRDIATPTPQHYDDTALLDLLSATADPADARRRLDRTESEYGNSWDFRPGTTVALNYAVLGDHEAARAVALRRATEQERSETLAALAGYSACVLGDPMAGRLTEYPLSVVPTARRLAALLFPPPSGPDLPRARALLAEALTSNGWHNCAQVLARIDPEAVLRAWDVVSDHLGLASSWEPHQVN
ncbi:trypsin-like peptidase domain-containing protein [Streptomyces sp. NBC_00366]|uniref:trypsin-like peptidase domain-containing protein n=1 Tax=Streptomyces sp. NBC_00366 TaxID=2975727 RepID=UPI002E26F8B1